jgi:hypothetical protein
MLELQAAHVHVLLAWQRHMCRQAVEGTAFALLTIEHHVNPAGRRQAAQVQNGIISFTCLFTLQEDTG